MPTTRLARILLALSALGLAATLHVHAQVNASPQGTQGTPGYTFQTLDAPGAWTTTLLDINNQGQIVGYYSLPSDTNQQRHSFLYEARTFTEIVDPLATGDTTVTGINNNGQIYGRYTAPSADGLEPNPTSHGFIDKRSSFTTISWRDYAIGVSGVNNRGQIVGTYGWRNSYCYIDINGAFTDITPPAAFNAYSLGTFVNITDINDQGEVIGYYYDSNTVGHSFLYTKGVWQPLSDPLATGGTYANGINNKGQIVGVYGTTVSLPGFTAIQYHNFLYDGGKFTTINFPAALRNASVNGINDAGKIVGIYSTPRRRYNQPAGNGFIATPIAK